MISLNNKKILNNFFDVIYEIILYLAKILISYILSIPINIFIWLDIFTDKTDIDVQIKHEGNSGEAQQDWSTVCDFFDNPFVLAAYELPPTVYTLANSAVKEMRRYYSRKVIDVLIKITRQSIDSLRKKFTQESGNHIALFAHQNQ